MKQFKKAFTLIELLVVIAIIGILAGLVTASLNSARAKARDAEVKSDLKAIQNANAMYFDENDTYATKLQDLVDAGFMPAGAKQRAGSNSDYNYDPIPDFKTGYRAYGKLEKAKSATLTNQADGGTGVFKDGDNYYFQVSS